MNEHFISKIYRSTVLAWALAMLWALVLGKPWIALSITLGTMVGTALLLTLDYTVRRAFVPEAKSPRRSLLIVALVKYPLIGLLLYVLVRWNRVSIPAFCGGIVLVHFAILAKLAGVRIKEKQNEHRIAASVIQGREN